MNDFNWDVIIRLATQGAKGSVDDLNKVAEAQDRLNRNGKITEKGLEQNTRAINKFSKAASDNARTLDNASASTNSLRYANYDLATTLFAVSAAYAAVGVASAVAFASQESAFTTVERIVSGTSTSIKTLRDDLQELSTQIPVSFNELSNIASLGAALDIPSSALAKFTEVVAKFAATTGVTVEAAAAGFGRLAAYFDLDPTQFDALGSAILRAGNISVATEEQVLKYSEALSIAGSRAGFTADQTVALAAGIASFSKINVEGAGSALSRVIDVIALSAAEGGERLEALAKISGLTAKEFQVAWGADSFGTLNRFIGGLRQFDNANLALKELGFQNERDRRTLNGLIQNYAKYQDIIGDTTSAWREGIYMNEAYGLVLDDLNSKWIIFTNAVTNAAAAVGATAGPALEQLLGITTDLLVAFADFAQSDIGQSIIRIASGALGLIAIWAALRGGIALATASALAFRTATSFLAGGGLAKGVIGLATALGIYTPAAAGATAGTWSLRNALFALGRATLVIGAIMLLSEIIFNFGGVMNAVRQPIHFFIDSVYNIGPALATAAQSIANFIASSLGPLGGVFRDVANSYAVLNAVLRNDAFRAQQHAGFDAWVDSLQSTEDATWGLGDAARSQIPAWQDLGEEGLEGLDDILNGADDAAEKVRTLTDYANDLASVWNRAFDIRFKGESTLDAITLSVLEMKEATAEAQRNIRSLKAEIQGLQSDLSIQQSFLAIAVEYRDMERAEAIRANIAKISAELADKEAELGKEQEKTNKSLKGNSKSAIENRKSVSDLVRSHLDHIQALAESGLSQEQLNAAVARSKEQFYQQAAQLGYSRVEVEKYAVAFDDVALSIARVPRDITVRADVNPAIQALNELEARSKAAAGRISNSLGGAFGGLNQSLIDMNKTANRLFLQAQLAEYTGLAVGAAAKGNSIAASTYTLLAKGILASIKAMGFAGGGYTGSGGKYEPAGIVHRGEYVIPKEKVNQRTGLPYADALGRLQRGAPGRSGYAGGGFVQPTRGREVVDLSAMSIQQLAMVMDKILVVNDQVVAKSASKVYADQTALGAH